MYLREMGTVPLLTREGEVAIAKRIEQGKLAVIKSISRTPQGDAGSHRDGRAAPPRRTDRARAGGLQRGRDHRREDRGAPARVPEAGRQGQGCSSTSSRSSRRSSATVAQGREAEVPPRPVEDPAARRWSSRGSIRKIEFTEIVKRRLIDGMKSAVEDIQARQREIRLIDQQLEPKGKQEGARGGKEDPPQAEGRAPQGNPRAWRRSSSSPSRS